MGRLATALGRSARCCASDCIDTLDVAVTIPDQTAFASTIVPVSDSPAPSKLPDDPAFASRYALGDSLGEGGMGVVRVTDARVARL